MEPAEFATNIHAFPPPHSTAQIRRELTLWRGGSHGRAEIFALPLALFAPLADEAKGGDGAKSAFRGYS